MRITLSSVFADAGALFRANADLLVRVAAVFYLLPVLAVGLFLPAPPTFPRDATLEVIGEATLAYWSADGHWLMWMIGALVSVYGSTVLLTLLLATDRPTVGAALARGLRVLPTYLLASLLRTLLTAFGLLALILPGLYIIGRTFVTGAVVVAEHRGPADALRRGIEHTRNNGLMLFGVALLMYFVSQFVASAINVTSLSIAGDDAGGQIFNLLLNLIAAALAAALALVQVLLEAAAYRLLTAPRPSRGI